MEQDKFESIKKVAESRLKPVTVEVEKRMIKRFAEAVGDENPLWLDENYSKKAGRDGISVPPTLPCTPMMLGMPVIPELPGFYDRGLFGGWSIEYFDEIRPGDVITSTPKVADIREREGKLGAMVLIDYETELRKENGELAARTKGTIIHY